MLGEILLSALEAARVRSTVGAVGIKNAHARGLLNSGVVSYDDLLVGSDRSVVLGCSQEGLRRTIASYCARMLQGGRTVVLLHEGDALLAREVVATVGRCSVIEVDRAKKLYDPFVSKSPQEILEFVVVALEAIGQGVPEGFASYLDACIRILDAKGQRPHVRLLGVCPHERLQEVVMALERCGRISVETGASIRAGLDACPAGGSTMRRVFGEIVGEGIMLADRGEFPWANSIEGLSRRPDPAALVIDMTSLGKRALLSLILEEVRRCDLRGERVSLVIKAKTLPKGEHMAAKVLSSLSGTGWVIAGDDALSLFANEEVVREITGEACRTVVFAQSLPSSSLLSPVFGEYDMDEVTRNTNTVGSLGKFGFVAGSNRGISIARRRERVVKPEEIRALGDGSFFVLDNAQRSVFEGKAS